MSGVYNWLLGLGLIWWSTRVACEVQAEVLEASFQACSCKLDARTGQNA